MTAAYFSGDIELLMKMLCLFLDTRAAVSLHLRGSSLWEGGEEERGRRRRDSPTATSLFPANFFFIIFLLSTGIQAWQLQPLLFLLSWQLHSGGRCSPWLVPLVSLPLQIKSCLTGGDGGRFFPVGSFFVSFLSKSEVILLISLLRLKMQLHCRSQHQRS